MQVVDHSTQQPGVARQSREDRDRQPDALVLHSPVEPRRIEEPSHESLDAGLALLHQQDSSAVLVNQTIVVIQKPSAQPCQEGASESLLVNGHDLPDIFFFRPTNG